jgi:AhpD family alkylhydroperoxidase
LRRGWYRKACIAAPRRPDPADQDHSFILEITKVAQRLDPYAAAPGAYSAMAGLEQYVRGSGLESALLELVKVRASQMNGCAYCLDMHTKDARAHGETEQRLYVVSAWREAPFYSDREQAALEWTEAVTRLGPHGVDEDVFARARAQFSETELVNLTMAIVAINGWNRIAIAFHAPEPGSYRVPG